MDLEKLKVEWLKREDRLKEIEDKIVELEFEEINIEKEQSYLRKEIEKKLKKEE